MTLKKRPLGSTSLEVSEIGFGALEIGRDWAPDVNADPTHLSEKEAGAVLNALLDAGINFIDTAPAYYLSEEFIGATISHRRDEFILATKVGEHWEPTKNFYDYSAEATERFIDQSLRRLKTDVIDLLQIHSAPLEVIESGETLEAMLKAKEAGKVKHVGMTGNVEQCAKAIEAGGYETIQVPFSILHPEAADDVFPQAKAQGIGVIIMRGLAGGKLTKKFEKLEDEALREGIRGFLSQGGLEYEPEDLAKLATQFVLAEDAVSSVIFGSRKVSHIESNIAAASGAMPRDLYDALRSYSKTLTNKGW